MYFIVLGSSMASARWVSLSGNSLAEGCSEPFLQKSGFSGPRTAAEWFSVSAFQQLQPDPQGQVQVFGNEGRNAVLGPRYVNWDFSATKSIRLTESKQLQFRGELFNVLNHTNFRLPVSDIESATFGEIQSDVAPRVIQVALKFLF